MLPLFRSQIQIEDGTAAAALKSPVAVATSGGNARRRRRRILVNPPVHCIGYSALVDGIHCIPSPIPIVI